MNVAAVLRSVWSRQLPNDRHGRVLWWMWYGLSLLLVVLAPPQLWDSVPFWKVPLGGLSQALLAGATFLALVVWLETRAATAAGVSFLSGVIAAAVCYGAAYTIFAVVRPDMAHSRAQFAISAALGITLAFVPYMLATKLRVIRIATLAALVTGVVVLGHRPALTGAPVRESLTTALAPISKSRYLNLLPPVTMGRGGAIEPYRESFVIVTADGDFYMLERSSGDAPVARRLPLALGRDRVVGNGRAGDHRVLDFKIDATGTPARVFVSSQEFNPAGQCFTIRVSVAIFDPTGQQPTAEDAWTRIFESAPCVAEKAPSFAYLESGGRLAFLGNQLLLTLGDFGMGHAVQPAPNQSDESPYGKVLLLDPSGGYQIFTKGHRNPQGLLVDADGRVWLTEHGAQGGDELNLLQRGSNYGYPLATYGTDYGRYIWTLAPSQHDHGVHAEPVHAFVPSIAISNLIRIEGDMFAAWKDDLLIASLHRSHLYRVRLRDDRVIYVEPIFVGVRIRDLAEGGDGRIVLWTDAGRIVELTYGASEPSGVMVFTRCQHCHEATPGASSFGPSIRDIVGADIAREQGYDYSAALRQLEGRWTEERLDAFLKDPDAFAPGSNMSAGQVPDAGERRALIEFLRTGR
jgi:cytochrome c2